MDPCQSWMLVLIGWGTHDFKKRVRLICLLRSQNRFIIISILLANISFICIPYLAIVLYCFETIYKVNFFNAVLSISSLQYKFPKKNSCIEIAECCDSSQTNFVTTRCKLIIIIIFLLKELTILEGTVVIKT